MEWFVALQEADKAYPPDYFAAQIRKSDAKIAWQYGRIFALVGVRDVDQLRVIDIGCGAGPGLRYLAGRGALVLLSELVEHIEDAGPLYEECYRVLRPGGRIIVTTPNLWDVRRVLSPLIGRRWSGDMDSTHVNLYTPTRLAAELRRAGFGQV